jgi:UDP-N-acetylglucosamine transferase subunit ALG13
MILVTVGSTQFPFLRMNTLVEGLARANATKELIIFQYGHTKPDTMPASVHTHSFISHRSLMDHMRKARIIICHGGPATIYQALSVGKIPWVLPRTKRLGEHLTDHQVEYSRFMARQHLIRIITDRTLLYEIFEQTTNVAPIRRETTQLAGYLDSLM